MGSEIIHDRETVERMMYAIWRDEARRLGFDEQTIQRLVFQRWRVRRQFVDDHTHTAQSGDPR